MITIDQIKACDDYEEPDNGEPIIILTVSVEGSRLRRAYIVREDNVVLQYREEKPQEFIYMEIKEHVPGSFDAAKEHYEALKQERMG